MIKVAAVDLGIVNPITITDGYTTLQTGKLEELLIYLKENQITTLVMGKVHGLLKTNICGNITPGFDLIEATGLPIIKVSEFNTSKTCLSCNMVGTHKKRLFICKCGFSLDRDILGAHNILRVYLGTFKSLKAPTKKLKPPKEPRVIIPWFVEYRKPALIMTESMKTIEF